MTPNFFFGGSHCQSVILFLDEIGGWREEGVLFNSARGPNTTNHSEGRAQDQGHSFSQ